MKLLKPLHSFVFLLVLWLLSLPALAQVTITGSTETTSPNSEVCVKVTVAGFKQMISMQYSHKWNPAVLQFKSIRNFRLGASPDLNFGTQSVNNGILTFSWNTNDFTNGDNLNDNTVIYEICFTAIGANGQFSLLEFTNTPRDIELSNLNGLVTLTRSNGRVNIGEQTSGGLEIKVGSATVGMNELACVPVTVSGFKNMISIQHSIKFDPVVLKFNKVQNFIFSSPISLTFGTQNVGRGEITFLWTADDLVNGQTLNDATKIYELCFDAIGECEKSSAVQITSSPTSLDASDTKGSVTPATVDGNVAIGSCQFSVVVASQLNPCFGQTNGAINITVFGKTNNTTFAWSNGATTEDISNLGPGTYNVTVTKPGSGTVTLAAAVVLSDAIMSINGVITDPTQSTASDGQINVSVANGSSPYTFQWSNGRTTEDITNLAEGNYSVTVTDANGCSASKQFVISLGVKVSSGVVKQITCNGANNGSVDITAGGGTSPYTYKWSNGPSTEDVSGLGAGNFTVTVTDSKGVSATATYTITDPPALVVNGTTTPPASGGSDGAINLTVDGGVKPYQFTWNTGSNTEDLPALAAGSYTVTVTDANQCSKVATFAVGDLGVNLAITQVACAGDATGSINATPTSGTAPYSFRWSSGATTQQLNNLKAGQYGLTVTDAAGKSFTSSVNVTEPARLLVSVDLSGSVATATTTGGTAPYTYKWTPTNFNTPTATLPDGAHTIVVTDAKGCQATSSKLVGIPGECYDGKTVITPNGDGLNDNLIILCSDQYTNRIEIFNSYGQLVYSQDNYSNDWDGRDRSNSALADGVYYWVMRVTLDNGDRRIYKGSVTLIRKLN